MISGRTWVIAMSLFVAVSVLAEETVSREAWQVSASEGELTGIVVAGTPLIAGLGDFRVAGKKVRPFREIAELRERSEDRLVYEGISDDGKHLYVEFGQVIEVGKTLDFMLFLSWLPPSVWPPDAVQGVMRFAPEVTGVDKVAIPAGTSVLPGTQDFEATLKSGKQVHIRAVGLDPENVTLKKENNSFYMEFRESRDYVSPISAKMNNRSLSYWTSSTDTHYIKFTFSLK